MLKTRHCRKMRATSLSYVLQVSTTVVTHACRRSSVYFHLDVVPSSPQGDKATVYSCTSRLTDPACKCAANYRPDDPDMNSYSNYWQRFAHVVDRFSNRPAIVFQRAQTLERLDYQALRAQAEGFAALLARTGVGRGHCCAIMGENSPGWCAAYLGILRLGAIAVPLDRTYAPAQVQTVLHDTDCRVLLASALCMPAVEAVQRLSTQYLQVVPLDRTARDLPQASSLEQMACPALRDDPAVILYTSGTTSDPKGVVLTHENLLAAVDGILSAFPMEQR